MRAFFAPAVALMNRLRFAQKFVLMAFIATVLVGVLTWQLVGIRSEQVATSRLEAAGLPVVTQAMGLVRSMQQHRGLSSGVLGGSTALEPRRAELEKVVNAGIPALEAMMPERMRSDEHWKGIKTRWADIQNGGLEMSTTLNFSEHSQLVGDALVVMGDLADHYRLTNDIDTEIYYLLDVGLVKLPAAIEGLAQVRGKGTGVLARKMMFDEESVLLNSKLVEAEGAFRSVELAIARIGLIDPELGKELAGPAKALQEQFGEVSRTVRSTILLNNFFGVEPKAFFDRATAAIDAGYAFVDKLAVPGAAAGIDRRVANLQARMRANVVLIVVLIAAIAYICVGAYLAILDGVHSLRDAANGMAQGDLTLRAAESSQDEVGEIAHSFNAMSTSVHGLVAAVAANAGSVLRAAQALESSAHKIAEASGEQAEASSSMAAAVEQMTVGIDHINRNAQEADTNTREAGELSRQGAGSVSGVVREMNEIADSVQDSARTIGELGELSKKISAIVGTIREIADQTNLLALNAAIEAARAGEAGRGFAVVADEVRKLAERTAASTREIAEIVRAIQGGTNAAVAAMQTGVARVEKGVVRSREAGESMAGIDRAMQHVVQTVGEISNALREQSAASTELAKSVERIAQKTEQNNAVVADNARTTGELRQLADALQGEVGRFRLS
jgi:methyl-accepting chemotaxis protein